jgi:O-succinylbenzoic acid--CoA ligase
VVGLPDPEWGQVVAAAVVADPAADAPDLDRLPDAVRAELGRVATPRRMRTLPEIPLLGIGKPDRAAVAEMLAGPHRSTG